MGIFLGPLRRIRDADRAQQLDHPDRHLIARAALVDPNRLGDLLADRHHRIQRGLGLLKDHGHAAAAHPAHLGLGQTRQIGLAEPHGPGRDASRGRQQPHQGQGGHGFAATRFAEQGKGLARTDQQIETIDHAHRPDFVAEQGRQPFNLEQGFGHVVSGQQARRL